LNKNRRASIDVTITQLQGALSALDSIEVEQPKFDTETIKDEEQEYFDAMPESLQSGEKGQAAEAAIESLETAQSELESAETSVDEIRAHIEAAIEALEAAKG
jgi:hypothetical protein